MQRASLSRCLECGQILPRGHGYKTARKFCSRDCFNLYQCGIKATKTEVVEILNRTQNQKVTAELLGTTRLSLHQWMKNNGIRKQILYAEE